MTTFTINNNLFITNGNIGIGTKVPTTCLDLSIRTDGIIIPRGTNLERPLVPLMGMLRYNTDLNTFEMYYNGWISITSTYNILKSATPTILPNSNSTSIIQGRNLTNTLKFNFRGKSGILYPVTIWTLNSPTQVTITRPVDISDNDQPYSLIAITLSDISYSLDDIFTLNQPVLAVNSAPIITSPLPLPLLGNTLLNSFTVNYVFTSSTPLDSPTTWTLDPSNNLLFNNNINLTTGILNLVFPLKSTTSGILKVTATNTYGNTFQEWSYNIISEGPPTNLSLQPSNIVANTYSTAYSNTYTFNATGQGNSIINWTLIPTNAYTTLTVLDASTCRVNLSYPIGTAGYGIYKLTASTTNYIDVIERQWSFDIAPNIFITLTSNQQNYNLRSDLIARGYTNPDNLTHIYVTINSGVYIWSDNIANAAFNTGVFTGSKTLTIENNGIIMGRGGDAGNPPQNGGNAINIQSTMTLYIKNNLYILGGGGGGSSTSLAGGGGGAGGGTGGSGSNLSGGYSIGGTGGSVGNDSTGGTASSAAGGGGGRTIVEMDVWNAPRIFSTYPTPPNLRAPGGGGHGGGGGGAYLVGPADTSSLRNQLAIGGNGYTFLVNDIEGNQNFNLYNAGGSNNTYTHVIHGGGGGGGYGTYGGRGRTIEYGTRSDIWVDYQGGIGGKAINLGGNSIIWITNGSVYGAVS